MKFIEEEVFEQLAEQVTLHSQSLVSELEKTTAVFKRDVADLQHLSKYAVMV